MFIYNPNNNESLRTRCKGCACHLSGAYSGEVLDGCCLECGCPKNLEGWKKWKEENWKKSKLYKLKSWI